EIYTYNIYKQIKIKMFGLGSLFQNTSAVIRGDDSFPMKIGSTVVNTRIGTVRRNINPIISPIIPPIISPIKIPSTPSIPADQKPDIESVPSSNKYKGNSGVELNETIPNESMGDIPIA